MSTGPGQTEEQRSAVSRSFGAILWVIRRSNEWMVILLFSALCTVLFLQVIARFILHAPFSWSEEMVRYFQVWLVLLGSAVTLRRGQHIVIDFVTHFMPYPVRRFFEILMMVITVGYLLVVLRFAPDVVYASSLQTSPAMQIPMNWVYTAVPLGAGLMLLEATIALVRSLMGLDPYERAVREEVS